MLLDLGANMELLDEAGFTALDQAALLGETGMAQTLLDRGANVRLPAAVTLPRTRDIERLVRKDPEALNRPFEQYPLCPLNAEDLAP